MFLHLAIQFSKGLRDSQKKSYERRDYGSVDELNVP